MDDNLPAGPFLCRCKLGIVLYITQIIEAVSEIVPSVPLNGKLNAIHFLEAVFNSDHQVTCSSNETYPSS